MAPTVLQDSAVKCRLILVKGIFVLGGDYHCRLKSDLSTQLTAFIVSGDACRMSAYTPVHVMGSNRYSLLLRSSCVFSPSINSPASYEMQCFSDLVS